MMETDSLLDKITCSVCKLPFGDTPKVLPGCLHVFCLACLDKLPLAFAYDRENNTSSDSTGSIEDCCQGEDLAMNEDHFGRQEYRSLNDGYLTSRRPRFLKTNSIPSEGLLKSDKKGRNSNLDPLASSPLGSSITLNVSCPKCGRVSSVPPSGFDKFKTSYVRSNLTWTYKAVEELQSKLCDLDCEKCVEKSPAVSYCSTCQQLICEDHTKCHDKWKEFASHKIFSLSTISGDSESTRTSSMIKQLTPSLRLGDMKCLRHSKQSDDNQFKFFCSSCEDLACVNCTVSTHRDDHGHNCVSITPDVVSEKMKSISASLEQIDSLVQDLDAFAGDIQMQSEAISKKVSVIQDCIDAVFTEVIDTLESRKLALFDKVTSIASAPLKQLKDFDKKVSGLRDQVLNSRNFIQENMDAEGNLGLLTVASVISKHTQEVVEEYKMLLPESKVEIPFIEFIDNRDLLYDSIASFGAINNCNQSESTKKMHQNFWLPDFRSSLKLKAITYSQPVSCDLESSTSVFSSNLQDSLTGTYVYPPPALLASELSSPVVIEIPKIVGVHVRNIEGLSKPSGIRVGKSSNLVVCEFGTHQVVTLNQNGTEISRFGKQGNKNGQFLFPQNTANEAQGKILVLDSMYRIQIFDRNKKFLTAIGTKGKGPLQFNDPVSIATSPDKRIYICERQNHRIQVLNSNFAFHSFIGKAGRKQCEFYLPSDIAISECGNIYVADSGNHRIQVLTLDGSFIFSFGKKGQEPGDLYQPSHLCVDSEGIFVSEEGNNRVSIFTLNGMFIRCFGQKGSGVGEFQRPLGVAIDENKTIYISDSKNDRIQIFK